MQTEEGVGYAVFVTAIDGGWISRYTRDQITGCIVGVKTTNNIHNALVMEGEEMEQVDAYLFEKKFDYRIFEW